MNLKITINEKKRFHVTRFAFAFFLITQIFTSGCIAPGPDYVKPSMDIPGHWNNKSQEKVEQVKQPSVQWWQSLNDPVLTDLIDQAISGNMDIKQAFSRIREARLQRLKSKSSLFPNLNLSASAKKNIQENESGSNVSSELYTTGFDAGWELDLFGGIRRSMEAAQKDTEAAVEDYHDIMISLLAEVAVNYINLRTYQARLAVAEKNVAIQKETWELLNSLAGAGLGNELSVAQARYNLESTRSKIPDLKTGIETVLNRLTVLTGQVPGSLHAKLTDMKPLPQVTMQQVIDIPANVIRRRPDVRKAEKELAAQTARIGVAKAERFPTLTLNGNIGFESLSPDTLFSTGSRIIQFGPSLNLPIFRAGAIQNNIKIQKELQQQAVMHYKASILSALEEVENALRAYAGEQKKVERLQDAADAARSAADLALHQYTTGMTDFNYVLEAQRSLLSFEDQLTESRGTVLTSLVRLYKALGGGWEIYDEKEPAGKSWKG